MKKIYLLLAVLALSLQLAAQKPPCTYLVGVYNNAVSLPSVKFNPLHPGIQVGFEKVWKEKRPLDAGPKFPPGVFLPAPGASWHPAVYPVRLQIPVL